MMNKYLAGQVGEAARIHIGLLPLMKVLFVVSNPVPVKYALNKAGFRAGKYDVLVATDMEVAAVEVTSHALALGRVAGSRFAVAAFTNLSQDHLDFPRRRLLRAKASLFSPEMAERAVIWVDHRAGERLASETALPVTTVGLRRPAAITALDLTMGLRGSAFLLAGVGDPIPVRLSLAGEFNVANALVAAGVAAVLGIPSIASPPASGQSPRCRAFESSRQEGLPW
jgi:UDP-N-acetylmuramyl pentapeptide synthase